MYERFEQLLKEHGVSAYKVSKETGIPQPTLSGWKRTNRTPRIRTLKSIADYFGFSVEYLKGEFESLLLRQNGNPQTATVWGFFLCFQCFAGFLARCENDFENRENTLLALFRTQKC